MRFLYQTTLVHRGSDEGREEGMGRQRSRFQLGVKLYADEPRVIRNLHDLRQSPVRRPTRNDESVLGKLARVAGVHFVAMTVAFADFRASVNFGDAAPRASNLRIR